MRNWYTNINFKELEKIRTQTLMHHKRLFEKKSNTALADWRGPIFYLQKMNRSSGKNLVNLKISNISYILQILQYKSHWAKFLRTWEKCNQNYLWRDYFFFIEIS